MTEQTVAHPSRSRIENIGVGVLFGLLFAYDVWEALGNLVGIVAYANSLQVGIVPWGWVVLVGAVLLPAVLWVAALILGWKRSIGQKLLVQILALSVSAVTYLSIIRMFNDTNLFVLG